MRILHVITSLGVGGAEKLMADLLPRMRGMGYEVELLTFDGTSTPFMRQLEQCGIKVHCLHKKGGVYTPINILRLMPYMHKYDVIHTHNTACQIYVPLAKMLMMGGARLVTTEHNTTNRRRGKWYFKLVDKWIYGRYSQIISISDKATAMLTDYIHPKGLITIENGIDIDVYRYAQPIGKSELVPDYGGEDVVVTMVAGFRKQKDQDCSIRAMKELPENYKLCLVGDGERRGEIVQLVASLGLQRRIRLLGVRNDVPQILQTSDINILASHWEGLSLSSVEGMASGKPFVASDVDGLREVVGGHGLLFPDGDYRQLAEIIRRLTVDQDECQRVGRSCAEAAKKYDIMLTAERYCEVYQKICKKMKIIRTSTVPTSLETFCRGTLKRLSQWYEVVVVSSPDENLEIISQREGVRTIGVAMCRQISPLRDLLSLVRLVRVFWEERPQMVHSITPKAGLLCMIAAWMCRVPVRLHTFTGLVFPTASGVKRRVLMLTDSITCACATHIVPEGEGVKHDLLRYGITGKPMRVLGYGNVRGVDMEYYSRTDEVMHLAGDIMRNDLFTFVFVGRVVRDKGIEELVSAFLRLHDEFPATRLLLVGRFEDAIDPISSATRHAINSCDAIESVGMQQDVRPWYAASDALVLPSYREGFPNVVLEAGALGLPSIVTDINGSREIIKAGENGVIVPPHDADALYGAMAEFLQSPEKVSDMAGRSRQMVQSRFNKQFVEQCLFDYYKEILQKH